jgi:hypothetical protein
MNNIQKRFLLFLGGCIPTRLFFAMMAKYGNVTIKKLLGIIAFMVATGFVFIYFGKLRETGLETGGEKIWWNHLRPIHAVLYYFFFYNVFFADINNAWKILIFDILIGLLSFLHFHLTNNSFSKLMS